MLALGDGGVLSVSVRKNNTYPSAIIVIQSKGSTGVRLSGLTGLTPRYLSPLVGPGLTGGLLHSYLVSRGVVAYPEVNLR